MIERQLGLGFVLVVFVSWFDVVVLLVEAVVAEPKVVVLVGEFGGVIMDEEFVDANVAAEVLGLVPLSFIPSSPPNRRQPPSCFLSL